MREGGFGREAREKGLELWVASLPDAADNKKSLRISQLSKRMAEEICMIWGSMTVGWPNRNEKTEKEISRVAKAGIGILPEMIREAFSGHARSSSLGEMVKAAIPEEKRGRVLVDAVKKVLTAHSKYVKNQELYSRIKEKILFAGLTGGFASKKEIIDFLCSSSTDFDTENNGGYSSLKKEASERLWKRGDKKVYARVNEDLQKIFVEKALEEDAEGLSRMASAGLFLISYENTRKLAEAAQSSGRGLEDEKMAKAIMECDKEMAFEGLVLSQYIEGEANKTFNEAAARIAKGEFSGQMERTDWLREIEFLAKKAGKEGLMGDGLRSLFQKEKGIVSKDRRERLRNILRCAMKVEHSAQKEDLIALMKEAGKDWLSIAESEILALEANEENMRAEKNKRRI